MTIEEAIEKVEYMIHVEVKWPGTEETVEALELAIDALLAQQEAEKNEPLTLDELRKMDGKPVWIVEYPDWGHWEISEDAEDYLSNRNENFYGMKYDDPCGKFGLHVLGWLAYRKKPEGKI